MQDLKPEQTQAILIVGPSWVGDMIMAQSLFKFIKRQRRDCAIDVLAPEWSKALLQYMPEVRSVITSPFAHGELKLGERLKLGHSLKHNKYQQVIVLPNSWKAALPGFAAGIPRRTGYPGEMRYGLINDRRTLNRVNLVRTVDRFVNLGLLDDEQGLPENLPRPVLEVPASDREQLLLKYQLHKQQPILALCPGAEYGPAKRWPLESFAEVAKQKLSEGWQVWIFGSEKEIRDGEQIRDLTSKQAVNLCGQTSLGEAVVLMSLADWVVTNDSGLMHVACALDCKVSAIFGSSSPVMTPPLSPKAKVLSAQVSCSPCFKRQCKRWSKSKQYQCLHDVKPEMVLQSQR